MKRFLAALLVLFLFGCSRKEALTLRKELNIPFVTDIKGFDPIHANDLYSHMACSQVYQGLLQYKYLARPFALEPLLAGAMPEISNDGLTYTFHLRPDVYFHDDPAFGGKKRPLRASDFVYSFKRLADPASRSPMYWILEGRVVGLDEFRAKLSNIKPPVAYEAHPVEGLTAPDDQTFVLRLKKRYRQLMDVLAMVPTMVVAHEVVEKYGAEFINHPVGTGPFVLNEWRRGETVNFERNPNYWVETYPSVGSEQDRKDGLLAAAGTRLPIVDVLHLRVYVESQPMWLNFLRGRLDISGISKDAYSSVFGADGELKEDMKKRKFALTREQDPDLVYFLFNLEDPILGKYKTLRQAISQAINRREMIRLFYNDRAVAAQGPVGPGLFGYDPDLRDPWSYNLEEAKKAKAKSLEEYRKDTGRNEFPPIEFDGVADSTHRQWFELIASDLKQIGLKMESRIGTWPQLQARISRRQIQFTGAAWGADYPDAENFLQLLYGKNVSPGPNNANFKNAVYDRLYDQMRDLPDGPERLEIIKKMVRIIHEEIPWVFFAHRIAHGLRQGWVRNFKRNSFSPGAYKYIDIDSNEKRETLPLLQ